MFQFRLAANTNLHYKGLDMTTKFVLYNHHFITFECLLDDFSNGLGVDILLFQCKVSLRDGITSGTTKRSENVSRIVAIPYHLIMVISIYTYDKYVFIRSAFCSICCG